LRPGTIRSSELGMIKVKDSVISLAGVVTGQIALFFCVSLIGHFHGPEALGHFNYLLALGMFAGTLLACRYELACVSDSPHRSFNAFVNVVVLSLVVSAALTALTLVAHRPELYVVNAFALAWFIQLAAGAYLNSLRWYGRIAVCRLVLNLSFLVCLLVDSLIPSVGKVDVFDIYASVNVIVAALMLAWIFALGKRRGYSFQVSREFFVQNNRFARYILPSTLCASVLTYALAIVIPHWFDATSAGYFAAAYRLGFFPVSLIGQSLGGVFRRDSVAAISRDDSHEMLPRVFLAYARSLSVMALLYAVFGSVLFGPLVRLCFGQRWGGAVTFYYYLVPLFTLQMIYVPLSQLFLATRQQRTDFMFQLACGATLLCVLFTARLTGLSVHQSVQAFSLAGAVLMIVGIKLTFGAMKGSISHLRVCA
jgi:O-antigen/teichoic acid export membrane protein